MNKFVYILVWIIILTTGSSLSQTYTWTGNQSSNWADSSNWDPAGIPDSNSTVIITSSSNECVLDQSRSITHLVVESGILNLNSYTLSIPIGTSTFTGGYIVSGIIEGNGESVVFSGSTIDSEVDFSCVMVELNGGTFNGPVEIEIRGVSANSNQNTGGCIFNNSAIINLASTSDAGVSLATESGNEFNGPVTLISHSSFDYKISEKGSSNFNNDLTLHLYSSGIFIIGNETTPSESETILAEGYRLFIENHSDEYTGVTLVKFTQSGAETLEFNISGYFIMNILDSYFNGELNLITSEVLLSGSTFNGPVTITKGGDLECNWDGGNIFNNQTTINNNGDATLNLGSRNGDTFNGDVLLNSSINKMTLANAGNNYFAGSITSYDNDVSLHSSEGEVILNGAGNQTLSHSDKYFFRNLKIDKSGGKVILSAPAIVANELNFVGGNIVTDSINILTMNAGSYVTGVSNTGFAEGPVKKIGNTAFEFPIGKDNYYRPFKISASANISDAFQVEYFNQGQLFGNSIDSTLTSISTCEYWRIKVVNGSLNSNLSLFYESGTCSFSGDRIAHIARWNGTKWIDTGVATETGSFRQTPNSMINEGYYAIALAPGLVFLSGTAINHTHDYFGYNSSNIIRAHGFEEPDYLNNLQMGSRLFPGSIRYPGGTVGNWWDWRQGWFLSENQLPNDWLLPSSYMNSDAGALGIDNHLIEVKPYVETLGATTQLMLNLLTSDLPYQQAFIAETHRLNIPTFHVELGNEYYLDDDEYIEAFATGDDYTFFAIDWTDQIKTKFGNSIKVGVVGSTSRPRDPIFRRRNEWLGEVISTLNGNTNQVDAIILHDYVGGGPNSNFPTTTNSAAVYNQIFAHTFSYVADQMSTTGDIGQIAATLPSTEIWITEFNLYDQNPLHRIHGTWAHGLKIASLLLSYLEEPQIKKIDLHSIVGNSTFATLFNDGNGFQNTGNFLPPLSTPASLSWNYSALGNAIAPIAQTIRKTTSHEQLVIVGPPFLDASQTIPGIYGWIFEGPESYEAIIVRLDFPIQGFPIEQINISGFWPSGISNYSIERWYQSNANYNSNPEKLGEGIIGNATTGGGTNLIRYELATAQSSNILDLEPYSITRLVFSKSNSNCSIIVTDAEICDGESTSLYVQGFDAGTTTLSFNATGCSCIESGTGQTLHGDEYTTVVTCTNSSTTTAGTCEITATTSNNVTCTKIITVYPELPSVSVTASSTPGGAFYLPGTVTLTASSSGGTVDHYIWIGDHNSDGITDPYDDQTDVDVQNTTDFHLYYSTDLSNQQCWAMETINIPVCNADAGPDRKICGNQPGDEVVIGTSEVLGLSYAWNHASDLDDQFSAQPIAQPSSSQTFTVTVTDGNGCSTTDDVLVDVLTNCCIGSTGDYVSQGESNMSDLRDFFGLSGNNCTLDLSGTGFSIYINGDLTINESDPRMTFQNCDIYFSPDAKIISSERDKDIAFETCSLNRCGSELWNGIYIANPSTSLNITASSEIDGCENCFVTSRGTTVNISESTFTNFHRAFSMEDYDNPSATSITGNTFTGTDNLPAPMNGQSSLCAICLIDVDGAIIGEGDNIANSPLQNVFEYSHYGIYSQQSSFTAVNNVFQHFHYPTTVSVHLRMANAMQTAGIEDKPSRAILAFSEPIINPLLWPVHKANIGEYATTYGFNEFEDCEQAIEIAAMSAEIVRNKITDSWRGIKIHKCWNKEIVLDHDSIMDADFGIDMYDNQTLSIENSYFGNWDPSIIKNCKIRVNSPWECTMDGHCTPGNVCGIRDVAVAAVYSMPIISNNFLETRGRYGIVLQNTTNSLIKDNQITMLQGNASFIPGPFYGIRTENAVGARIGCNTINGNGDGYILRKRGISSSNSPTLLTQCNETHQTEIGLQFIANCDLSIIKGNEMNYHKYGYYIGEGDVSAPGIIGNQTAVINNGYAPGNLFQGDPSSPGNFPSGYGLYRTHPIVSNYFNDFEVSPNQGNLYLNTSSGSNLPGNSINPIINIIDPIFACVANSCVSMLIEDGAFSIQNMESRIASALLDDGIQAAIKHSQIRTLYNYLKSHPEMLNESEELSGFVDSLDQTNHSAFRSIYLLFDQLADTLVQSDSASYFTLCSAAADEIDEIDPDNDYEVNEKDALYLLIKYPYSKNNQVTSSDSLLIESIASQCPYDVGPSVFIARGLYILINDTVFFNDSLICNTSGSRQIAQQESLHSKTINAISAIPNPSSNVIKFEFTTNQKLAGFKVINHLGQVILTGNICNDCNSEVLDVSEFNEGPYLILIENSHTEVVLMKQFIVIK